MSNHLQITATELYPSANLIGEGPVWHAARNSFFWGDIERKKLREMSWADKQVQVWEMPQRIGLVVVAEDGNLIVALQDGLAKFDLKTAAIEWLMDIEKDIANNRANDGKCDSEGRLWLGTMDVQASQNSGALYCVHGNSITPRLTLLTLSNGMAWLLDNNRFYFIDSPQRKIDAYLFDAVTGTIHFERTAVEVPEAMGMPDGMCIDEEGMLWVAHWGGHCVARWTPETGELLYRIELPLPQVSSCVFGGENLDELFITTASEGLSEVELQLYPSSGHVFVAQPGVKGVAANHYRQN
ncbi:MAG: SMP-30/gluconolactonase/LRE family protein [Bacteroidota bacterium]